MEKSYLEDYYVGERFVTPARTITETDVVLFSAFTGDWHPIHTDKEYAKASPFGERIAHGMLVLTVGSALCHRLGNYVFTPKSFIAFYGMEHVRFTKPVKIGDTLHLETEIIEIAFKDNQRGTYTAKNSIKNQHGEDCCVFTTKVLCGRRPEGT